MKVDNLLDEKSKESAWENIKDFVFCPESFLILLVIIVVIFSMAYISSVYSECNGTVVRGIFGYECIEVVK